MRGESTKLGRSGKVKQPDGGIGRGRQDLSSCSRRELGRVNRPVRRNQSALRVVQAAQDHSLLFVCADRPQDGTAVDVEHLYESAFVAGYAQLAVGPDFSARRRLFKPRDRLDDAVCFGRIDL